MTSIRVILSLGMLLAAANVRAADVAAGQAVFKSQCSICHQVVAGKNGVGPSLFGVVGRETGSIPGYAYSPANKNAHITWDAAKLNTYLADPRGTIPGTKMTYAGLKDPAKRADLIAYLETVK